MATTKNITMKQFNGTDYDTLYPKTKVEQVENLTPSSIGAVNKSGDTMTGDLWLLANENGAVRVSGWDDSNGGKFMTIEASKTGGSKGRLIFNSSSNDMDLIFQKYEEDTFYNTWNVLHTGNAQALGFPKIATGSYVGTGNCGPNYPMSINVGFTPKFFWIGLYEYTRVQDGVTMEIMMDTGRNATNGLFIYPATRFLSSPNQNLDYYVTVTWGSTMSWYGFLDDPTEYGEYQFNRAGVTYYWVAIG